MKLGRQVGPCPDRIVLDGDKERGTASQQPPILAQTAAWIKTPLGSGRPL